MRSDLPSGWKNANLGELAHNHDKRRVPMSSRERQKRQGPYPYWGANGVLDHVDDYIFEGPHVLVAEDGTVERDDGRAVVHWVSDQFWVNNHAHVLTASRGANQRWLYYALRNIRVAPFLTGSVQLKLTQKNLRQIPLVAPPEDEQDRIASVLVLLDDKIENNRRVAKTLEEIAATLFKARFVDFIDHDDLVNSELGPIPKGWHVGTLADVATVTMGQSPPSTTYSDDPASGPVMVQGKGVFGPRFPKAAVFCRAPTRMAEPGDLLMTVRAPVGDLNVCSEPTCLGRGVAGIASGHPGFVEFALREVAQRWRAHEGGTIYPSVNKKQVGRFPIVIPPEQAVDEFERIAAPMRDRLAGCHREMTSLSRTRDALLPRLISGELRVPPTNSVAAEAA